MDGKINNFDDEQKRLSFKIKETSDQIKKAAKHLRDAKREVIISKEEKDTLSLELQELIKQKTKLDFSINDLSEEVKGDNNSKVSYVYKIIKLSLIRILHANKCKLINLKNTRFLCTLVNFIFLIE